MRPSLVAGLSGVVLPSTVNYAYAAFAPGIMGPSSTTNNPAKHYLISSYAQWVGYITGTEAKVTATSDWGLNAGLIEVSIDGGAFASAALEGGRYTLFTGLAQAKRLVQIRINSAYATVGHVPTSGTVLTVTGAPPSVELPAGWVQAAQASPTNAITAAARTAADAGFSPDYIGGSGTGSNVPMVVIRGPFRKLFIGGTFSYAYVSKDGAAPTRVGPFSGGLSALKAAVFECDGSTATYYVWGTNNQTAGGGGVFGVSGDAARVAVGVTRRAVQYGDSITYGQSGSSPGDVDTMRVFAALGICSATSGVSGDTIATLKARLAGEIARRTIGASDIAVLAIGRNNADGALDATETTDFGDLLTTLRASYSKVIVRGVLPEGVTTWTDTNGSIQSIVTGRADPNIVYVDPTSWSGIATSDGVHPTDAGYLTIAGYAQPAYAPLV